MRIVTVREANQGFSRILAEVTNGETTLISKNGRVVAELRPRPHNPRQDPAWQAAHRRLVERVRSWPDHGDRVGAITDEDKYDDASL